MDWTSFGAGLLVGLAAWTPLTMFLAWRLRGVGANEVPILERVQRALLRLSQEQHREILDLFSTERFVTTDNRNYRELEAVARDLEMIQ